MNPYEKERKQMNHEQDRLRRRLAKFLSQYLEIEKPPLKDPDVEILLDIVTKEVRRAEKRERLACLADVDRYIQSVVGFDNVGFDNGVYIEYFI